MFITCCFEIFITLFVLFDETYIFCIKDLKREQDAEMKKYLEEIEAEELRQEDEMQKAEHNDQVKRELDDAKFQIHLYKKADKLADKFEERAAKLRLVFNEC